MQKNQRKMTATVVNPEAVVADRHLFFNYKSKAMKKNDQLQKDPGCCEPGSLCCGNGGGCC